MAQSLSLILATLQLSSQPQLLVLNDAELEEERQYWGVKDGKDQRMLEKVQSYWQDRAAHWQGKFEQLLASLAPPSLALTRTQLQSQPQVYGDLLEQLEDEEAEAKRLGDLLQECANELQGEENT